MCLYKEQFPQVDLLRQKDYRKFKNMSLLICLSIYKLPTYTPIRSVFEWHLLCALTKAFNSNDVFAN